jgi:hypothetical protein
MAEWRTLDGASEDCQLLTECKILKRDRSVPAAEQRDRSEHDDERGRYELSCGATDRRIKRLAGRSDIVEPQAA